ncbi:MAG: AarF/ABC1/UbiB kinase family protein [Deltaproteobacteria bacterium]|nr:AarF/ABC1/UbiB kinase family protein [Deltaproteobacteria bacterium]
MDTDIVILGYLARLALKYIPESAPYDPVGIVDEFSMVIRKEMDFTLEASYMERFRTNFAGDGRVMIPKVYWKYSGKLVLTMERVDGIKADRVDKLRERGIDTRKVAHIVADVFFKQVFDFGLFHGDLHSGNIFVVGPERIALVDFGIVGRLDGKLKAQLAEVFINLVSENFEGLIKVYQDMGILPEHIDKASFEREYYDIILRYFGRPFKYVSVGEILMDYIRLAARHGVMLPRELLLFDKCLIELEGLSRLLFPEANILEESGVYTSRLFMERYSPTAMAQEALQTLSEAKSFISRLPGQAENIMNKIAGDRLRIEFVHRGLEDFIGEMDRSSNRLTFGIIMAALVIGSSLVISTDTAPRIWGYAAIGVLGFLIASLLGFWLAFQILRSGKF